MKNVSFASLVTLIGTAVLGLTITNYPFEPGRADHPSRMSVHVSNTLGISVQFAPRGLKALTRSLAFLPTVERAIAAKNPDLMKDRDVFQDADVRLTRVGPVRIGMTLEEATDALGLPLTSLGSNLNGECSYYQPDTRSQALGLMTVDNRVIRVDIWPGSSLETVSGATIGTSEADLKKLYAGQIKEAPNPYTEGKFLTFVPNDPELALYRLVFETDATGKVVQYRTGQFPAVTWPDGCV